MTRSTRAPPRAAAALAVPCCCLACAETLPHGAHGRALARQGPLAGGLLPRCAPKRGQDSAYLSAVAAVVQRPRARCAGRGLVLGRGGPSAPPVGRSGRKDARSAARKASSLSHVLGGAGARRTRRPGGRDAAAREREREIGDSSWLSGRESKLDLGAAPRSSESPKPPRTWSSDLVTKGPRPRGSSEALALYKDLLRPLQNIRASSGDLLRSAERFSSEFLRPLLRHLLRGAPRGLVSPHSSSDVHSAHSGTTVHSSGPRSPRSRPTTYEATYEVTSYVTSDLVAAPSFSL